MTTTDQQESAKDTPEVNTPMATEQGGTPDQPEPTDDGKGGGNKEAAKYRRQLRDVEAERDTLTDTVAGLQRQLVAGNLPRGSKLTVEALTSAGLEPADFFNEEGALDTEKLGAEVRETHKKLGVPIRLGVVPGSGTGSGGEGYVPTTLAGEARKKQG